MPLMWIKSDPARHRSEPRPGYVAGKYAIVREQPSRYRLVVNDCPPAAIMVGGLDECKQCAEACEEGATEFFYEPDLSDLCALAPEERTVIEKGRRVALSVERLRTIFIKKLPGQVRALELAILRAATKDLGGVLETAEGLL